MARNEERSGFRYRERSKEDWDKRAKQSGGQYDRYIDDKFETFTPKEGDYTLRILPPTDDDAQHYGMDVFVHYGVGPDSASYICLKKMKGEACPICEEAQRAEKSGDTEYAKELKPNKRVLVWVVDRDQEDDGPKLWAMPYTVDRDIGNLAIDRRTGEIYPVDHPEEGYDVMFSRQGAGLKTKYVGLQIARKPSPLAESEKLQAKWLRFIQDNPLSSVLRYYDHDYIRSVFDGGPPKERDDDRDKGDGQRGKRRGDTSGSDEEERKPRSRSLRDDDDDEPARRPKAKENDDDERDEDDERDYEPKPNPARRRLSRNASEEEEEEKVPTRRGSKDDSVKESVRDRLRRLREEGDR